MTLKAPSVAAVMAGVLGLFMLVAGFGTVIPGLIHDRMPEQFVPLWSVVLGVSPDSPRGGAVMLLARGSQVVIALTEWLVAVVMLAAAFLPRRRLALTQLGVGLSIALFGAFMLTTFALHDPALPRWNQYPAILAWLGATWLVVALADGPGPRAEGRRR